MTSLSDAVPLSAYRDSLQRYLQEKSASFDCVAGEIIAARLPLRYVHDVLRPALLLWACEVNGGDRTDALPVAAAFDLFDRFLVLHDELANDDAESIARWGLGQSLNAGDALYALAFRHLAGDVVNQQRRLAVARFVAEAVLAAIEGGDGRMAASRSLSAAALRAGALLGGASPDVSALFARAGRLLAEAADARDAQSSLQYAREAVALLASRANSADLETFSEAAFYVARRAA